MCRSRSTARWASSTGSPLRACASRAWPAVTFSSSSATAPRSTIPATASSRRRSVSRLFSRVLVANRGEIACRIIRQLQAMGSEAVAVHSASDATTLPVRMADVTVALGAAPLSYLDGAAIVAAARSTGAEAIHPGYGFLAERAEFAEQVEAAGLAFIGPTPEQLRSFGAKHTARSLAAAAGVPLLPASDLLDGLDDALAAGAQIGYPLALKATAGGGGIGLRICRDERQLREGFDGAHHQAGAAFGDHRM